jgi:hypothetical protein
MSLSRRRPKMMVMVRLKKCLAGHPVVQVGAQVAHQKIQITTATASLVIQAMASTKLKSYLI